MKRKTIRIIIPPRNHHRLLTKQEMFEMLEKWELENDNKTN